MRVNSITFRVLRTELCNAVEDRGYLEARDHPGDRKEIPAGRTGGRRPMIMVAGPVAPPVSELLDVDREYRLGAKRGKLQYIAPRKFNPKGETWLPILHTVRNGRRYTALFSNTERAHRTGRTHDWVVLYYRDGGSAERQCTVVTEFRSPLTGKRVVRGRELECADHYGVELEHQDDQRWLKEVMR